MKTTNDRAVARADDSFSRYVVDSGWPRWLRRWYGLVIAGAVTVGVVALALSQHWLAVADLAPLLFILPCAVMMFICMKGMNHGQQNDSAQAADRNETSTATDTQN
jgi:hypothetical protein